ATVDAGEGLLAETADERLEPLLPLRLLLGELDVEAAQLHRRRRLAGAELDAPARDEVERRDALGRARGMVVERRRLQDAVAEADVLRALARGREEDLRRRGVAVLLEEVVLDRPDVLDAQPVGELDLGERVLEELVLGVRRPGTGQLV